MRSSACGNGVFEQTACGNVAAFLMVVIARHARCGCLSNLLPCRMCQCWTCTGSTPVDNIGKPSSKCPPCTPLPKREMIWV